MSFEKHANSLVVSKPSSKVYSEMYIVSLHRFQHAIYKRNRNIILLGSVGEEETHFF